MKRALTTPLISLLAATALVTLSALVTPPNALADAPPSARAPHSSYSEVLQMRRKVRMAHKHLTRIDRLIRDKELDLKVYDRLNPIAMDDEDQSFSYDIKETATQLKRLRARRTELAAAIVTATSMYRTGFTDLQPSRGYASDRRN